jgi:DNA topoisomerase-2
LEELNQKWTELDNKVRFILAVVKEEIIVRNRKKAELLKELAAKKFTPIYKEKKKKKKTVTAEEVDDGDAEESESEANESEAKSGYDYLLSMPLWSLTLEKVEALIKQRKEKEDELKELMDTPIKVLWERDLDAFEKALDVSLSFHSLLE